MGSLTSIYIDRVCYSYLSFRVMKLLFLLILAIQLFGKQSERYYQEKFASYMLAK
jgi:hypothetical protein